MTCRHEQLDSQPQNDGLAFRCQGCGACVAIGHMPEWHGMEPGEILRASGELARRMMTARDEVFATPEPLKPYEPDRTGHQRQAIRCRPEVTGPTGLQTGRLLYHARCECGWSSELFYADEGGEAQAREAGIRHWSAPDLDEIEQLVEQWKTL